MHLLRIKVILFSTFTPHQISHLVGVRLYNRIMVLITPNRNPNSNTPLRRHQGVKCFVGKHTMTKLNQFTSYSVEKYRNNSVSLIVTAL